MKYVKTFQRFLSERHGLGEDWSYEQLQALPVPEFLYHHTSPQHRVSIQANGLLTEYSQAHEAVYMSTNGAYEYGDMWEVCTSGLPEEFSVDTDMMFVDTDFSTGEIWYAYYGDVPPTHLRLANP